MKRLLISIVGFGFGGLLVSRQIFFLYRFLSHQEIQEKVVSKSKQWISVGILVPAGIILIIYTYLLIKKQK